MIFGVCYIVKCVLCHTDEIRICAQRYRLSKVISQTDAGGSSITHTRRETRIAKAIKKSRYCSDEIHIKIAHICVNTKNNTHTHT